MRDQQDTGPRLFLSATVLIATKILVTLGGFVAVAWIVAKFGIQSETDAYFTARLVPITLLAPIGTALHSSFLANFMQSLADNGREVAIRTGSSFVNLALAASLVFTVLYILLSPMIISLLAPGFPQDLRRLTVALTCIMAFSMFFSNAHALFDALLNAEKKFIAPAVTSLWGPVCILGSLWLASDVWGMKGIALGVSAGYALQTLTLLPSMRHHWPHYSFFIDFGSRDLRIALHQFWLACLVVATWQINSIVDRMFGSFLGEGAVSALSLGYLLLGVFPLLLAFPIIKVLYPALASLIIEGDHQKLGELFSKNFLFVTFVTLPVTIILTLLPTDVVKLVFWSKSIAPAAIQQTATVVQFLALSLPSSIASLLMMYYFLITRRTKLLVNVMCLTVLLNAAMDYILMKAFGLGGIALSSSVLVLLRMIFLLVMLRMSIHGPSMRTLFLPTVKMATAAAAMGALMIFVSGFLAGGEWLESFQGQVLKLTLIGSLALVAYIGINLLLRNRELFQLMDGFRTAK